MDVCRAYGLDSPAPWILSWANSNVCVLRHFPEPSLPKGSSSGLPALVAGLTRHLKLAGFPFLQLSPLTILYLAGKPPALSPHIRVCFWKPCTPFLTDSPSQWCPEDHQWQKTLGRWCQQALRGPGVCPPGASRVPASTYALLVSS